MIDPKIIGEFERLLEEEKNKIEKELSEIAVKSPHQKDSWDASYPAGTDDRSAASGAYEEMEDEIEEYHERLTEEKTLEERVHEINQALARIDGGTYGMCSVCGKEIPMERLRANPAASTDIEHADKDKME